MRTVSTQNLGAVESYSIRSSLGPFHRFTEYRVTYPPVVIEALCQLYQEYNAAFDPLVGANREWDTDYRYAFLDGVPCNFAVQVDMVDLDGQTLARLSMLPIETVRRELRCKIFELENSLAMYQLLERIFQCGDEDSFFRSRYREVLGDLRRRTGLPIALLAVTQQKYDAMRETEFGKQTGETLTDTEVFELSGFDRFFGPDEFRQYLSDNHGRCGYLLFVRSSDPVAKLKRPDTSVDQPLLGDPQMRRVIKANAVTFNIDAPDQLPAVRINDTKEYQPIMGMALRITSEADLYTDEFMKYQASGRPFVEYTGTRLSTSLTTYLQSVGVDPSNVAHGRAGLRFKPAKGTYGCYGHVSGLLTESKVRGELRRNLAQRGAYLVQPELTTPRIVNEVCGTEYTYIDRNFFGVTGGKPMFLGGFRSMMPTTSNEAKAGRVHGNGDAVWIEIVG